MNYPAPEWRAVRKVQNLLIFVCLGLWNFQKLLKSEGRQVCEFFEALLIFFFSAIRRQEIRKEEPKFIEKYLLRNCTGLRYSCFTLFSLALLLMSVGFINYSGLDFEYPFTSGSNWFSTFTGLVTRGERTVENSILTWPHPHGTDFRRNRRSVSECIRHCFTFFKKNS